MKSYEEKKTKLLIKMDKYTENDVAVAFSGGVDSSLILKIACNYARKKDKKVYAVTLHTMLHPVNEIENAIKVAKELGAIHFVIKIDELINAGISKNPVNRCYMCKKYLFSEVIKKAKEWNVSTILEGTNEDDLHVYRPGIQAIQELGIISPLAGAGIEKDEVRKMAFELGISVSSRPSAPCLATRFPYGTILTYEKMTNVEKGEEFIRTFGVYNVRLRIHENIARIEVDEQDINKILTNKKDIISYLKNMGYIYVTVDLEGFRSGSMDIT